MKVGAAGGGNRRVGRGAAGAAPTPPAARLPFRQVLQNETVRETALAEEDLEAVDRAAAALRSAPTLDNLRIYREAIRAFLAKALAAYQVDEVRTFNRYGKRSITYLVRIVDARLDQLARTVLANARDTLAIAVQLDDIRGLLLDCIR